MNELQIGGQMSTETANIVTGKASTNLDGLRACSCNHNNPNMQLSLLKRVSSLNCVSQI
jgi:adenine deaminase